MQRGNNSWADFVSDNLLSKGLVYGLCLITHQAVPVYSYGILNDLPELTPVRMPRKNGEANDLVAVLGCRLIKLLERQAVKPAQVNWHQFITAFQYGTPKHDTEICNRGFKLQERCGRVVKFNVYQKTFNSVYSIGEGEWTGLLVCNLPYGILLTTYHRPNDAATVVEAVEQFCQKLRQ